MLDQYKKISINSLTGIRILAALWVTIYHFRDYFNDIMPEIHSILIFFNTGYLGVDLFFILSGFILSYNYLYDFKTFNKKKYINFLSARFSRIYPVHLFTLFLLLILFLFALSIGIRINSHTNSFTFETFIKNILLINAWGHVETLSWNFPAWSISAEWFAYIIFPFIAIYINRIKSIYLSVIYLIICLSLTLFILSIHNDYLIKSNALIRITGEFLSGCFLLTIFQSRKFFNFFWNKVDLFLSFITIILIILFSNSTNETGNFYFIPLFTLLIFSLAHEKGIISNILSKPVMIYWGEASYSLYMIHAIILMLFSKIFPSSHFHNTNLIIRTSLLLFVMLSIMISSSLIYKFIEIPSRKYLRKLLRQ